MRKQHGQSAVEFALIAPMIFLMIFGMIWGGYMFMEYLRFSNDVRAAARDIALSTTETRQSKIDNYKVTLLETYSTAEVPKLYEVTSDTIKIYEENEDNSDGVEKKDIVVNISFKRRDELLPNVLLWVNFPPDTIPAINYRMRIEQTTTSSGTT